MRLARSQPGFSWLLVAVVTIGTMLPPGVRHSHAGGSKPHHHGAPTGHHHDDDDDEHLVAHHHSHDAASEHDHDHGLPEVIAANPIDAGEGASEHVHFSWFGLVFWFGLGTSLPAPGAPAQNSSFANEVAQPTLVRAIDDGLTSVRPALDWLSVVVLDARPLILRSNIDGAAFFRACDKAIPAFLCDTARHERSGTQLI